MKGGLSIIITALVLSFGLGSGCSGVLLESRHEDGTAERLKVQSLEGWTSWDSRFTQKHEEIGAVVKREMEF
jgi:hypothetical protein